MIKYRYTKLNTSTVFLNKKYMKIYNIEKYRKSKKNPEVVTRQDL